jgi:dihydrofolate synthase/folylpolyglutamate synthase
MDRMTESDPTHLSPPATYREALDWIYGFSDTERTGAFVRDKEDNLRRERALLAALGDPQRAYGVTHIAGTKGKGSTAAMVAAVLNAAGIRTGLYTQPDLHTFRERMRVGETLISEREVVELVPELRAALAAVGPDVGPYITYEVGTALAFLYFQRAGAQHAVIEVGLGGRLDATNVVEPLVAVITSISYDHMQVLGNTLEAIAGEKAGIIKPGVPTVCSVQAPEALAVIRRVCEERGSRLVLVGSAGTRGAAYTYQAGPYTSRAQWLDVRTPAGEYAGLELALLGEHQLENATAAVAAVEELRATGLPVDEAALRAGLSGVRWPARLQVLGERPWLVVDSAHNADSMARLLAALPRHFTYERLVLVLGLLADKDLPGVAREVARVAPALVIATAPGSPRGMPGAMLAAGLRAAAPELTVREEPRMDAALADGLAATSPRDLLCVAGSVYGSGEALRSLAAHGGAAVTEPIEVAGVDH